MRVPNLVSIGPQAATCIRPEGYTDTHTLSYIDIDVCVYPGCKTLLPKIVACEGPLIMIQDLSIKKNNNNKKLKIKSRKKGVFAN